jgi:hypothetical protein
MASLSLRTLAVLGAAALGVTTSFLAPNPAAAQVEAGYHLDDDDDDDELDRPRVQRRVEIDEEGPRVERRIIERRIVRPVVERHIVERQIVQPVVERRVIVQRPVRPVVERRIVHRRPIVHRVVERPIVRHTVIRPAIVRPVVERRIVEPVVEERRIVRAAAPVDECRVVVRHRENAFGERVTVRTRICD